MTTFLYPPAALLYLLLFLSVISDIKTRRIPNKLIFPGTFSAVIMHLLLPPGSGFFSISAGGIGFLPSIAGLAIGLVLLMPMYALRAMGAGDVKMLAMVGAFFGPIAIINIFFLTLIAGGIFSVLAALWNRALLQTFSNVWHMANQSIFRLMTGGSATVDPPQVSTARLPYALAIASGTILYIMLMKTGVRTLLI